eukprot:6177989-Pleurochrysis_carterae.AAC.1
MPYLRALRQHEGTQYMTTISLLVTYFVKMSTRKAAVSYVSASTGLQRSPGDLPIPRCGRCAAYLLHGYDSPICHKVFIMFCERHQYGAPPQSWRYESLRVSAMRASRLRIRNKFN